MPILQPPCGRRASRDQFELARVMADNVGKVALPRYQGP